MVSFPSGAVCYSLFSPLPIHLLCITSQSDFPKSLVSDLICLTLLLESALPQPLPSTTLQLPMGRSVLGEAEEQRGSKGLAGLTPGRTDWRPHRDKGLLASGSRSQQGRQAVRVPSRGDRNPPRSADPGKDAALLCCLRSPW